MKKIKKYSYNLFEVLFSFSVFSLTQISLFAADTLAYVVFPTYSSHKQIYS